MKRVDGLHRAGSPLCQSIRVFAQMEPAPLTKEEKAELRAAKKDAEEERAAIRAVESEAEAEREAARLARDAKYAAARLADWRSEAGPPRPPQNPTGFYVCERMDGAYYPVGTGPWPDYRPPGLAWERHWKLAKPADVPWADEVPKPPVWAADPKPIREAVGKAKQGSLFG